VVDRWYVSTPVKAVTIPRLGTDSEDLVCRCITLKSGDVTKETQSSFTDDVK